MEYEVEFTSRPFGMAVCDKLIQPFICAVADYLPAAAKGVRVGSLITAIGDAKTSNLSPNQVAHILSSLTFPVIIKFCYDPELIAKQPKDICNNWYSFVLTFFIQPEDEKPKMTVVVDCLALYERPTLTAPPIASLTKGIVVTVLEAAGIFLLVSHPSLPSARWCRKLTDDLDQTLSNLDKKQEDEVVDANHVRVPTFLRQNTLEVQEMKSGIDGKYLSSVAALADYWRKFAIVVADMLEEIGVNIGLDVASMITDYTRFETVAKSEWDFPYVTRDAEGQKATGAISNFILNGKPSVLLFLAKSITTAPGDYKKEIASGDQKGIGVLDAYCENFRDTINFVIIVLKKCEGKERPAVSGQTVQPPAGEPPPQHAPEFAETPPLPDEHSEDTLITDVDVRYFGQPVKHCAVCVAYEHDCQYYDSAETSQFVVTNEAGMIIYTGILLTSVVKILELRYKKYRRT